jgi:hypothetical protein
MEDIYTSSAIFQTYFDKAPEKAWVVGLLRSRLQFDGDTAVIFDAGCHDGKLTQRIVNQYYDVLPQSTQIIGVDPCANAIARFNQIHFGDKISACGYAATIEEFLQNNNDKFDLTIASQSLYWCMDLPGIVRQIVNASRQTLIVLRDKTGIYQIQKTFPELVGNKQEQFYNADDVRDALVSLNLPFAREDKSTYIPLPERHSSAYQHMLNFFLQTAADQLASHDAARVNEFIAARFGNELRHDVSSFWINIRV